jgi:TetR/AcrR family transcriptional repressor of nem operon
MSITAPSASPATGPSARPAANRPGRPRAFDEGDAITAMTAVFRRNGYEAASLDDLTAAAGLSRSSFYGCFGSKHGAMLACMQAYADRALADAEALAHAAPDGRAAALGLVTSMAGANMAAGGCLVVNCMAELAPRDPAAAAILTAHLARLRDLMARALAFDAADGTSPDAADGTSPDAADGTSPDDHGPDRGPDQAPDQGGADDLAGALLALAIGALSLRKAGVSQAGADAARAAAVLIAARHGPAPG